MKNEKLFINCISYGHSVYFYFDFNQTVVSLIQTIPGIKWSETNKIWKIPYSKNYLQTLNEQFKDKLVFKEIKEYKTKQIPKEYYQTLELKNYSQPTIKTYTSYFQRFLNYFPNLNLNEIKKEQIREYLLYLVNEKKYSTSAQNNAINAIVFYYKNVLQQPIDSYYFPRPRIEKKLPKIISEKEVVSILKNIEDIRIKCMTFFVYSAGMTPSEVLFLRVSDIDSEKMSVFISSAKGDKNRSVFLSQKLLALLREYYKIYKPTFWLFESAPQKHFSKSTFQKLFKKAVDKSRINKDATLTILKNSFTVHLLEKGVDVRFVQEILGHKNSKTMMKYVKVSNRNLKLIQSPLDDLDI